MKIKTILLLLALSFCLISCGKIESKSPKPLSIKIEKLSQLETSPFFTEYQPRKTDAYALRDGGFNSVYNLSSIPHLTFTVQNQGDMFLGAGFVFHNRESIDMKDLQIVFDFIQTIDPETDLDQEARNYIQTNANIQSYQVRAAKPSTFNLLKVYAGKVGEDEIVQIDYSKNYSYVPVK